MNDDRPINPDKKYLEQFIQKISKVETKPYLKKKSQPFLPCQLHVLNTSKSKQKRMNEVKTKAEVYEEIKRKNRQKFGQKKVDEPIVKEQKKLDPKKMTVNYKPKYKYPIIDVQQYKKQGNKKGQSRLTTTVVNQKVQYQKLLDYFNDEIKNFEKEKEQFNKNAAKLKYKDFISKQDGLSFAKIKSQVQKQLITQVLSEKGRNSQQNEKKKINSSDPQFQLQRSQKNMTKLTNNFVNSYSIEQVRSCMAETSLKMRQMKQKLLKKDTKINQHRYDISQINILPSFDPQTLFDYIDGQKLRYNANDSYLKALTAFNAKFNRQSQNEQDVCGNLQQQQVLKKQIGVKFVGEKRVMKYEGWTQVWIPGRQRLMANSQGYKVIWLNNGDVLQQFPNNISTYYSKAKRIYKIDFAKMAPVYYHRDTGQLWREMDDGSREIVFSNGRRELVQINLSQNK